jgi:hypothetical protein
MARPRGGDADAVVPIKEVVAVADNATRKRLVLFEKPLMT